MIEFITPMGRIVQGSPLEPSTTDSQGKPLTIKTGPNAGQPRTNFFIAVAIPKNDPGWPAFKALLDQESRAGYPQHHNAQTGQCTHPRFTQKISDGDGVDANGQPNSAKEGFAGHWVVKFSSSYAPKLFHKGQLLNEKTAIKRGDWVRVAGNAAANIGSDVPGLYLNHNGIELLYQGDAIVSGPDAGAMFAAAPAAALPLPPGARAVTLGHGTPAPFPAAPGGIPMPPVMQAPPPPVAHMPPPPPVMAPPAPPTAPQPAFTMTALAGAYTREQYLQQGYTDDMLVAQGFMVKHAPPPNPAFVQAPPPPPAGPRMTAAANGATYDQMRGAGWSDQQLLDAGMMTR